MLLRVSNPNFPSPFSPDRGSKSWIKKYMKACWDDFSTIKTQSFYNGRQRYNNIRLYMLGRQPMEKYFEMLDVDTANADKSWLKAVKEPFPIVAKFARMSKSTLMKNTYNINLKAVDPVSMEEKNEYYARNRSRIELRDMFKKNGLPEDLIEKPDREFKSVKELDIFMEYGFKSRYEIEGQQVIKLILNNSGHDRIRELNIDQLHDYGFVGYKDYIDINGDIKEDFVDVRNVIVSRCMYPDFRDAFYMGEVLDLTLADVKQMDIKREINEEDYKKIFMQRSSNNIHYSTNNIISPQDYENERVQVLDIEFYGVDSYVLETRKDKNGNPVSGRVKDIGSVKADEYEKADYKVIYTGKWIIGTDIYFGCGLQTNMKRPRNNISDVQFSRHMCAPNLDNMETRSMAENYIPVADGIQVTFMKYQDVIISAKKKGILIDINALENVPLGKGGVALTPIEQFDFYKKTGSLIYRSIKEDGKISTYKPIEELNNGLGDEANRYFNEIQNQIYLIQQMSGYNELTDGSTPDERTLKGVAKQAADSTNNSIDFMKRAERNCFESLASGLLLRVQDAAELGTLNNFVNAIGMDSVKFFELGSDFSARELGIQIKDEPTEYEKETLNKRIEIAIQSGQITIADAFVVENIEDVKYAEAYLGLMINENLEKQQEIKLQNEKMNAQVQQQSAELTSQLKLQEIQAEAQAKLQITEAEKNKELELLDKKYAYELQLKQLEVTGRIEQNKLQADAKIYSSDRQSKTTEAVAAENIKKETLHKAIDVEHENEMADIEEDKNEE